MGDHRMSVKIEMEFHGVKDKCDMWINFSPRDYDGIDHRVIEFLESVYDRGMEKYNKEVNDYFKEKNKYKVEAEEKAELKRLQEKYGLD